MSVIDDCISRFERIFDGEPWYGNNISTILYPISTQKAFHRFENNKSIAEILLHLITWQKFALEKLNGNVEFQVYQTPLDWQNISDQSDESWEYLKKNFYQTKYELVDQLKTFDDQFLYKIVEGKNYNYLTLINGIIDHNIYHFGQISLLFKQLN